jgi:hypothetical protein
MFLVERVGGRMPDPCIDGRGGLQMDNTRINLAGGWTIIWGAISSALGGVGGALTVIGTLVVVLGFVSWLWQKRRGTGGGQGHSGLLWTIAIGAMLVTPGVVLPILLTAVDIVLNACITLWNRVSQ